MRFNDVHGTDWTFRSVDGETLYRFPFSGYAITADDKEAAQEFERDHPDWTKEIEHF